MLTKKNIVTFLLLIILLGAFLRFFKLGDNSFVADEFLDINSSYAYAKTSVWQNWDFNFGKVNTENAFAPRDERAWIYKWQVAQLFKILPPTESTARTISVLWGIFSIILIFFVAKYFSRKNEIGLLSAFLFTISISGLIFDRRLRMYAMFFAVFLALSWMVFKFIEEKYEGKNKLLKAMNDKTDLNFVYFLPVLILGVISILTHQLTANIIFVLIIYSLIQIGLTVRSGGSLVNKYSIFILLVITGFIGGIILIPKQLGEYTAGLQFFNNNFSYFSKVFADYSNAFLAIIFIALGIYFLWKKQNLKKETLWLASSFFTILLLAVFIWDRNAGEQYIFFALSFEMILISTGIYFLAEFFQKNLAGVSQKVFIITIFLTLLILPNYTYFFQENNIYNQTSNSETPNFRKVFAFFKKSKLDGDVLITRNFRNYYWSGAKVKVFDFGGELAKEKLSLEQIKKITTENSSGWFIISDNDEDYIANDVITFAEKNMEKVSNVAVRGKIKVYRWGEIK